MPVQTEHVPEWLDEMADSRYPFEDAAPLRSNGSSPVTVPNEFLLDACLYAGFDEVGLYSITVPPDRSQPVTLAFAPPAADTFATASLTPGATLADVYQNRSAAGVLVLAPNWGDAAAGWPPGTHRFDHRRNRLVPAAVKTSPPVGVEGFTAGGETLGGEVWVVGDDGVVIRPDGDGRLRVDVTGDPLFRRRRCEPDDAFVTPLFVRTINGHPPDAYGGFVVTAEPGSPLRIYATGGELRIELASAENNA